MFFRFAKQSALFSLIVCCVLPTCAQADSRLFDPVLENTPLPDYHYAPDGRDTPESWMALLSARQQRENARHPARDAQSYRERMKAFVEANPGMPEYLRQAYEAYRVTGDRNLHHFALAASEFQKQHLREQLMRHLDDPEKLNRLLSILYGKPHQPYTPVGQSGYVLNRETGEILKGDDTLTRAYNRKLAAQATGKRQSSRSRENSRGRTYREDRDGGPTQSMKAKYQAARKRALEAGRTDIVEELDKTAIKNGFFD